MNRGKVILYNVLDNFIIFDSWLISLSNYYYVILSDVYKIPLKVRLYHCYFEHLLKYDIIFD